MGGGGRPGQWSLFQAKHEKDILVVVVVDDAIVAVVVFTARGGGEGNSGALAG